MFVAPSFSGQKGSIEDLAEQLCISRASQAREPMGLCPSPKTGLLSVTGMLKMCHLSFIQAMLTQSLLCERH